MIYDDFIAPKDKELYAFAYNVSNQNLTLKNKAKPYKAIIRGTKCIEIKPSNKEGYEVLITSRQYADTKQEANKEYNRLVEEHIQLLRDSIETAYFQLIEEEND